MNIPSMVIQRYILVFHLELTKQHQTICLFFDVIILLRGLFNESL